MKRKANAIWKGSGLEGQGTLTTASKVLNQSPYSHDTRFKDDPGTNPEELIAAAHAGCFNMKLSFNIGGAGFTPQELHSDCVVTFADGAIVQSHITLTATVEGIDPQKFDELVKDAELNCPISKLLDTEIVVEYTLNV